jgi:hypothetical protein
MFLEVPNVATCLLGEGKYLLMKGRIPMMKNTPCQTTVVRNGVTQVLGGDGETAILIDDITIEGNTTREIMVPCRIVSCSSAVQ